MGWKRISQVFGNVVCTRYKTVKYFGCQIWTHKNIKPTFHCFHSKLIQVALEHDTVHLFYKMIVSYKGALVEYLSVPVIVVNSFLLHLPTC